RCSECQVSAMNTRERLCFVQETSQLNRGRRNCNRAQPDPGFDGFGGGCRNEFVFRIRRERVGGCSGFFLWPRSGVRPLKAARFAKLPRQVGLFRILRTWATVG